MINLAISGCHGRMGQAICKLAFQDPKQFKIKTLLEHKNHPNVKNPINGISVSTDNASLKGCDALIEFTLPEATMLNMETAVKNHVRMVIGTTGCNDEQIAQIKAASKKIPIVFSSNMSIGVNVFFKLIEMASQKLANIQNISIGETHHIHKKDAPSGTAKTMKQVADKVSSIKAEFDPKKIKREGEVIGYHEITFETDFDSLTITHNAKDRAMFAKGALEAAKFLMNKKSGLYTMQDILGLN